jgi:hypothetical protein
MDPRTGGDEQEPPRPAEPAVEPYELGFEPLPMRRLRGGVDDDWAAAAANDEARSSCNSRFLPTRGRWVRRCW